MKELSQPLFDIYCLARPRGQDFGDASPIAAWRSDDAMAFGVALSAPSMGERFDIRSYRRRVDHVWAETASEQGFTRLSAARAQIGELLLEGAPPEPLPRNTAARPALHDLKGRTAGSLLRILTAPSHHPAGWMLNQLYLSLPAPDANWAADCQTQNFHTRLWEAQLLATFREQGLLVTQPHPSPDFRIENADGGAAWVEAVTANPQSLMTTSMRRSHFRTPNRICSSAPQPSGSPRRWATSSNADTTSSLTSTAIRS